MPALLTKDVEAAEPVDCLAHHSLDVVAADHVHSERERLAAGRGDLGRHPRRLRLVQVGDRDAGALMGQPEGDRPPDAAAGAGDDRDLAAQLVARHQWPEAFGSTGPCTSSTMKP
jgi:hypothetical protein